MILSMLPGSAFADGQTGVGAQPSDSGLDSGSAEVLSCPNHLQHDESCGYVAGTRVPCSHKNADGSYNCAPEQDSGDPGYRCDHEDGCGYTPGSVGSPCTHSCELCHPTCDCVTLCVEGAVNAECPVCGAEGADLSLCEGKAALMTLAAPRSTVLEVTTTKQLNDAIYNKTHTSFKLMNNLDSDKYVVFYQSNTDDYFLDLNGHTINSSAGATISWNGTGSLTITNGQIKNRSTDKNVKYLSTIEMVPHSEQIPGDLVMEKVTVTSAVPEGGALCALYGGSVTLTDCTLNGSVYLSVTTLDITGSSIIGKQTDEPTLRTADGATVTIHGSQTKPSIISGGNWAVDKAPTLNLANYNPKLVKISGSAKADGSGAAEITQSQLSKSFTSYKYLKFEQGAAPTSITDSAALVAAFTAAADGATIKLAASFSLAGSPTLSGAKSVILDLAGNTLTCPSPYNLVVEKGSSLTIIDSDPGNKGKITGSNFWNLAVYDSSKLMVTDGLVENTKSDGCAIYTNDKFTGTITISDTAEITSSNTNSAASNRPGAIFLTSGSTGTVRLLGGTVENKGSGGGYAVCVGAVGTIAIPSGAPILKGDKVVDKAPDLTGYDKVQIKGSTTDSAGGTLANVTKEALAASPTSYKYLTFVQLYDVALNTTTGTTYTDLPAAVAAANDGSNDNDTIQLLNSIELGAMLKTPRTAKNLTIDLNGYTIDGKANVAMTHEGTGTLTIADSKGGGRITGSNYLLFNGTIDISATIGNIAITGGTIECSQNVTSINGAVTNRNGGTITVSGTAKVNGKAHPAIYSIGSGKVILTGGTVSATAAYALNVGSNRSIMVPSGEPVIYSDKQAVTSAPDTTGYQGVKVTASTNADGSSPEAAYNPSDASILTYKYLTFSQVDAAKNTNTGTVYADLQDAVTAVKQGQAIQLLSSIELAGTVKIDSSTSKSFTLDLNGYTIDGKNNQAIFHQGTGTLVIKDSKGGGRITGTNILLANYSSGTITVTGGTIECSEDTTTPMGAIFNRSGTIYVGGTARVNGKNHPAIYASSGTVKIEGGEISSSIATRSVPQLAAIHVDSGKVILEGGTVSALGLNSDTSKKAIAIFVGTPSADSIKIYPGTPVIRGATQAMNVAPNLTYYSSVKVTASTKYAGSPTTTYDPAAIESYRYLTFAIQKTPEPTPNADFTATGTDTGRLTDITNKMRYSLDGGSSWKEITKEEIVDGTTGDDSATTTGAILLTGVTAANGVKLYQPAGDTVYKDDSAVQTINVTQASKPTGVAATDETWKKNDGTLTGVDEYMEYRLSTDTDYTAITGATVTKRKPGSYAVRIKAIDRALASEDVTVTVAAFVKATPTKADLSFNLSPVTYNGSERPIAVTAKNGRVLGDITVLYGGGSALPRNAGSYAVTVNLTGSAEYEALTGLSLGTLVINKAPVTVSIACTGKVYDGNNAATVTYTVNGKLGSDVVTASGTAATYSDKNAGTGKAVTASGITLSGAAVNNYRLTGSTAATTASITKVPLTGGTIKAGRSRDYDGTAKLTGIPVTYAGGVNNENVTGLVSGSTDDANAGSAKPLTVTGQTLDAAYAANYTLPANNKVTGKVEIKKINPTLVIDAPTSQLGGKDITVTVTISNPKGATTGFPAANEIDLNAVKNATEKTALAAVVGKPGVYQATYTLATYDPDSAADNQAAFSVSIPAETANYNADMIGETKTVVISDKYGSQVAVSANQGSASYGASVTLTATVSKASPADPIAPVGTVQFKLNGSNQGEPITIDAQGKATLTLDKSVLTSDATLGGKPYSITAKFVSANPELADSASSAMTVTVSQKMLSITAKDQYAYQHKQLPVPELIYDGFVEGETEAVLGANAYTATHSVPDALQYGEFAIHVTGSTTNTNYDILPIDGKLIILEDTNEKRPPVAELPTAPAEKPVVIAQPVDPDRQLRFITSELIPDEEQAVASWLAANSQIDPETARMQSHEVELQVSRDGSTWQKATMADVAQGLVKVALPVPEGTTPSTHRYTIYHFGNGADQPANEQFNSPEYDAGSNTLSATVTSMSPFAVVATPKSGGSSGGSSGGGSSDDSPRTDNSYAFWMEVKDQIEQAASGDVVKANAKSYDKMPRVVMDALLQNSGVGLVISWNGGKTITIPAGKVQQSEINRVYWPLSRLAELYADIPTDAVLTQINPGTGGVAYVPVSGGSTLVAEASETVYGSNTPATIRELAVTPSDAGFEAVASPAVTVTQPAAKATANTSTPWSGLALLLAGAALGGVWMLRRKHTENR